MSQSQEHAHYLGAVVDKIWHQSPGSFILVSLGGVARAAFAQYMQQAQANQAAVDVSAQNLTDFSVRQITLDLMDELSGGVVTRLSEEATSNSTPVAIPGHQMRHVLLLSEEYDELRATRLSVLPTGELEVSVACEYLHDDRSFAVKGTIDLKKVLAEYPLAAAG